jgi:hypothetical protein
MKGRILFYNSQTGQGKVILQSGEKIAFSADMWDDFDTMPETGTTVECDLKNGALQGLHASASPLDEVAEEAEAPIVPPTPINPNGPTFTVEQTLSNYFKPIDYLIGEPPEVVNTRNQLDYFLIRRFLMTAYNDLRSLDPSLHSNREVKEKQGEIQELHKAYHTVKDRVEKSKLAFEMIFLRSQPEYLKFIRYKEQCLNRISTLSQMEESLFPDIQKKEEQLKKLKPSEEEKRHKMEEELKSLRRHYVDAIHENAGLAEELNTMEDVKATYTDRYLDQFVKELLKRGGEYMKVLAKILGYRAYDFDQLIWQHAAKSKMIREYFANARIKGSYSTLTFLRYYLQSLDKEKVSVEQKELFKLQEYLEKRAKK